MTWSMLVRGHLCCVAGQGFEPWKASADGFTVRSHWPLGQPAWWPVAPAAGHDTQSVTSSGNGPGEYGRQRRARKEDMVADPSFDVVSKVDRQEVDNALNQAAKELSTRFDFRGTGAKAKNALFHHGRTKPAIGRSCCSRGPRDTGRRASNANRCGKRHPLCSRLGQQPP